MEHLTLAGLEILVLEDELLLRKQIAAALERLKADVMSVGTVAAARGLAAEQSFDFARLDVNLPDGTRVACKRKGLKIALAVGPKKGEGLMRRLAVSKDPVVMLRAALRAAARAAGVELKVTATEILISG